MPQVGLWHAFGVVTGRRDWSRVAAMIVAYPVTGRFYYRYCKMAGAGVRVI
jgi:hypothetical protein